MFISPFINNSIIIGEHSINETNIKNKKIQDVWNIKSKKKRILFCGTYPIGTTNGYSKITYYLCKYLGLYEDIELSIWGFQNYKQTGPNVRNDIPSSVKILDPYQIEKDNNIEGHGFGEKIISDHLKNNAYDIIIIFNDSMITSALTANIINNTQRYRNKFKLLSYMDQVYMYQKPDYIKILNDHFDGIITFTSYWKTIAYKIGIKKSMPLYIFNHGFDNNIYFPIPKEYSRLYFNMSIDAFIIGSSNRNQPRKGWDIAIMTWAKFVKIHFIINVKNEDHIQLKKNNFTNREIKFMIATNNDGHWNILDMLEHECKLIDLDFEYAKKTLWFIENPQQVSDRDINIFMNTIDINFAPVHAEGWGLTCSESLGIGTVQLASNVGGHKEFMNNTMSTLIEPLFHKYGELNKNMKGIGSIDEICNPNDFVNGLCKYFTNPHLLNEHGNKGRKHILNNYKWQDVIKNFKENVLDNIN
jgi:glycosyltransferase involved in cell wall biosynthesis